MTEVDCRVKRTSSRVCVVNKYVYGATTTRIILQQERLTAVVFPRRRKYHKNISAELIFTTKNCAGISKSDFPGDIPAFI